MELTKGQEKGLAIAINRYNANEKYTVISGWAGTGKSTLVKVIIENLNIDSKTVCYATFTGKAAEVLRKKGNSNAITLHKLLYDTVLKSDGSFIRKPKMKLEYKIIIVDECSMVPLDMVKLLLSYNVHVIFLGDNFQLPPINSNDDNHLLDNPHVILTEIMRQETDSEIIQVTTAIREFKPIPIINGKDVKIFSKQELSTGMLTWADQIICATNATRININTQMRDLLGHQGGPQDGDKIICCRNYWDYCSEGMEDALINGTIGYLRDSYDGQMYLPQNIKVTNHNIDTICGSLDIGNGDYFSDLIIDKNQIITGNKTLDRKVEYQISRCKFLPPPPLDFNYGYAITCHKAQGSQFDKVLVIEEKFPFEKEEHARWLYTACTRAVEKLVLVR